MGVVLTLQHALRPPSELALVTTLPFLSFSALLSSKGMPFLSHWQAPVFLCLIDQCSLALFSSSVVLLDHLILRAACIRQGGTRARKSLLIGVYIRCSYKETENLFGFRSSGLEVPIVNAGGFTEIQFQTCPLFGVCHRLGRAVHIGSYACMLSPQLMN